VFYNATGRNLIRLDRVELHQGVIIMKLAIPQGLTLLPIKTSRPIYIVSLKQRSTFLKTQPSITERKVKSENWNNAGELLSLQDSKGIITGLAFLIPQNLSLYATANLVEIIQTKFDDAFLNDGFHLEFFKETPKHSETIYAGWSLASYRFDTFKKTNKIRPLLYCPKADYKHIQSLLESIYLVRDLINMPPNKMMPEDLVDTAESLCNLHKAKLITIKGEELIDTKFPLIYEVGKGSENSPQLIDFTWGNPKHKKITIVGKGICFDTGGYDIKPSSAMLLMKKDMGGSAMALGLAHFIMGEKLPVRLRVLIPAAENSISGKAYRPSDILTSRKGLSVEIGNTDAEGRLVMADCLTAACEDHPDLLIDFSTLTGAARSALGFDLPALFSNDNQLAQKLQAVSMECDDPMWHMPLWSPYKKDIMSPVADINNAGSNPAGAVTAALFLEHFITPETKWIHIDHYAWEPSGKAGRPRGGTDMGMRALFEYIKQII
jgi:leucyl aminopeptidase